MSAQKKIVIKPSAASAAAASAVTVVAPLQQKKVVIAKASGAASAAAPKVVVSAPKRIVQKVVMVPQIVEEVEEEEAPKTAQQIYDEIQVLLGQLVQISGGKKVKGLKKDGTPRAKRTNTSGWNQFVKDFCAENPGVSWKDAMVLCKPMWAALKGEVAEAEEEEVAEEEESAAAPAPAPAPKPAAKLVIKKPSAPPAKTAEQILAELAEAKAKAEEEAKAAAAAAEAEAEVEVEEFEWEGQTLQKNAEGFCWRVDETGEQIFVGRWDGEKMDECAEEPTYGSA